MAAIPKSITSSPSWKARSGASRADGAARTGRRLRSVPGPLRPGRHSSGPHGGRRRPRGRDRSGARAPRIDAVVGEAGTARPHRGGIAGAGLRRSGVLRRVAQGEAPRLAPRLAGREGAGRVTQLRRRRRATRHRGRAGAGRNSRRVAPASRAGVARAAWTGGPAPPLRRAADGRTGGVRGCARSRRRRRGTDRGRQTRRGARRGGRRGNRRVHRPRRIVRGRCGGREDVQAAAGCALRRPRRRARHHRRDAERSLRGAGHRGRKGAAARPRSHGGSSGPSRDRRRRRGRRGGGGAGSGAARARMSDGLLVVAVEASADLHGAAVLRELRSLRPDVRAFGAAGPLLRGEGCEALVRAEDLSVMGIAEVLPALPRIFRALRTLTRAAKGRMPRAALLIDSPDFNLRLARRLRRLGIPVAYFIGPSVWAWRTYRVRQIARDVARMLVILPFEAEFYARHGVRAVYVGNPLADGFRPALPAASAPT